MRKIFSLVVPFLTITFVWTPGATHAQTLLREFMSPHEAELGLFGRVVASVPDTDGDGHSDLLIGAANDGPAGRV